MDINNDVYGMSYLDVDVVMIEDEVDAIDVEKNSDSAYITGEFITEKECGGIYMVKLYLIV